MPGREVDEDAASDETATDDERETEVDVGVGGDPACWLDQLCELCGMVVQDDPADHTCPPERIGLTPPAATPG